jgi:tetratricopeptide (TPR) repeat protein
MENYSRAISLNLPGKHQTFLLVFLVAFSVLAAFAQPAKLTKEQLGEKGNELLNAGKQREALDLVDTYPEFADEASVLYIKSVAYTELRDYKNADVFFKVQFDKFVDNADAARRDAANILADNPPTKDNNDLAMLMYGASLISYASADMVNSLRATAFDKNGMPAAVRTPKDIQGYAAMVIAYKQVSIEAGLFQLKTGQLKDALANINKAVQLAPADAATYLARAKVYRKLGKVALARADETKARRFGGK